jgi:CAAX prenyl protease-like protein
MSRAASATAGSRPRAARPSVRQTAQNALQGYMKRSERPLASLAFVLPLILIHEIGWRFSGSHLLAFYLLHQFLAFFGATATILPALTLIGILLAWHIVSRDKWTVRVDTLLGMALESLILALPLLAFATALARWELRPVLAGLSGGFPDRIVIAMGAGIYEELIFRLIALSILHTLFVNILRMPKTRAGILMVVTSAIMFSLYHYLGPEKFAWKTCLFRVMAGIYFGGIFLTRGFGVTAGCHAFYDMIICGLVAAA